MASKIQTTSRITLSGEAWSELTRGIDKTQESFWQQAEIDRRIEAIVERYAAMRP